MSDVLTFLSFVGYYLAAALAIGFIKIAAKDGDVADHPGPLSMLFWPLVVITACCTWIVKFLTWLTFK